MSSQDIVNGGDDCKTQCFERDETSAELFLTFAIAGPFEGPEKLLEIWFTDRAENVLPAQGLHAVSRRDWEAMLDLVHCKVLSVISGNGLDAYMLRCVCFASNGVVDSRVTL